MEAVKSVLRRVKENAVECDQNVRDVATQAQRAIFNDCNIISSHSCCRALISTSIMTSIHMLTPQKTCGTLIPLAIEERITGVVRRVRSSTKLPIFPDVLAWVTHIIKETYYAHNFYDFYADINSSLELSAPLRGRYTSG
jgi:hypothetical protein